MFKKITYRIKLFSSLNTFAKGVRKFIYLNLILSLLSGILPFVQPLFYKVFIDEVILNQQISRLTHVLIGYIFIHLINVIIGYIKNYSRNRLINRVTFRVKYKFWNRLFNKDFSSYPTLNIGDTKMRLEDDTNYISTFFEEQIIGYIINYFMLFFSITLMFIIKWQLALLSFVAIPIAFILDHIISKKEWKLNELIRDNAQKQSGWLHSSIQGWREVKALNLQKHEERRLVKFTHIFSKNYTKANNYNVTRIFVLPKIRDEFLMQFLLYFVGGMLIIGSNFTIGSLLMFAQYCNIFTNAVSSISLADANLQSKRATSDRLFSEIEKSKVRINNKKITPVDFNSIEFRNVSFMYPNGHRYILKDFNLRIVKGERIAITGKSGCGKTTLLKLMTGMLEPTKGNILFSDIDIQAIDLRQLHKHIGFVMQENVLFNSSIRDNLLLGKQNASETELKEACRQAYIYDFIQSLPEKYETIIGEKGIMLSGGQRQRIVLARLFLKQVDVFIFDEATSALDQHSENFIHDIIKNIKQDKTIIVVSHRKSSIDLCERTVELTEPEVVNIYDH